MIFYVAKYAYAVLVYVANENNKKNWAFKGLIGYFKFDSSSGVVLAIPIVIIDVY